MVLAPPHGVDSYLKLTRRAGFLGPGIHGYPEAVNSVRRLFAARGACHGPRELHHIISVFCIIDDFFRQSYPKLRQRSPAPTLADREVLIIEAVGEFLHIDADRELYGISARSAPD
jgi:hypothetical protein